jgi:hypothetical protein
MNAIDPAGSGVAEGDGRAAAEGAVVTGRAGRAPANCAEFVAEGLPTDTSPQAVRTKATAASKRRERMEMLLLVREEQPIAAYAWEFQVARDAATNWPLDSGVAGCVRA